MIGTQLKNIQIMKQSVDKPKKIVINNARKSIMGGGGIGGPDSKNLTHLSQVGGMMTQVSATINNQNQQIQFQVNKEIARLNEQLTYYREKHDQSLIKVRFLTERLETFGGLNSIPDTIASQISEVDSKIKNLQELLYFSRSKQMKKLKKKIQKFVEMLEFDLSEDDMNKIEDQIEIIFFIIDIFSEKYSNLMTEKAQIDQIVSALKQDTVFTRQQLQQQNKALKQKSFEHMQYIRQLQLEVFTLKKDSNTLLVRNTSNADTLSRNQSVYTNNQNTKIFDQTLRTLQQENEHLISNAFKLESSIKNYEYEIINYKRSIEDYKNLLNNEKAKSRELEEELLKVQREEVRWKQRYQIMQKQKNQRIELLQKQKRAVENYNFRLNTSAAREISQRDENFLDKHRRRSTISIKKKYSPNSKFRNEQHMIQDSGEEYYDLVDR